MATLLSACGGGAGEPQVQNDVTNPAANAALTLNPVTTTVAAGSSTYEGTTVKLEYGAKAHLTDVTRINGATGQGVTILVIDDFDQMTESTLTLPNIQRKIKYREGVNSYAAIYNVNYEMPIQFNHGQLVSDIAGGTQGTQTIKTVLKNVLLSDTDLASCTVIANTAKLPDCPTSFHATAPTTTLNATLTVDAIPGVAAAANILQRKVNLSASQDVASTIASIQGHLQNSVGSTIPSVVNLSLGTDLATTGKSSSEVLALVQKYPLTQTSDAVITVAAGNSGKPCNDTDLYGCNAIAVAMWVQPETKASTIVVGALTGATGAQKMAMYSTSAGFLKDRYILASGDTGLTSTTQGTSFAAPRVAGVAAILKQKYPQLTSTQIADIILKSANKDMNNDGIDDFIGIDPIFGHGKLSLDNALKLAAQY